MSIFQRISCGINNLFHGKKSEVCKIKEAHNRLSTKQVDKTIDDSFPASDPPSWY